jgi:hypothetical protein
MVYNIKVTVNYCSFYKSHISKLGYIISIIVLTTSFSFSATSTNYGIGLGGTNSGSSIQNTSSNFSVGCSEFGRIGEGIITSGSYSISAALPCELNPIGINFRFAPEKRVQLSPPNLSMKDMQISLRSVGSEPFSVPLAVSSVATSTDVNGYSIAPVTVTVTPGSYDVFIKSSAHLNQKYGTINYTGAATTIDFTQGLTQYAKAGDVNGSQFGDDEVNALDISVTIANLSLSTYRPDTNQDGTVNALDIGILIANLGETGE